MPGKVSVAFVVPYPENRAPSQRFRVELFLPILQEAGIHYRVIPFLDTATYTILYSNASPIKKAWGVLKGFLKRLWLVFFELHRFDFVFIHREASPLGPPVFEFLISKIFRKKIVYDFDDAIWIPESGNDLLNRCKAYWKIRIICQWAYKISAGNDYLCAYARKYNKNVVLLPTCVDTMHRHNRLRDEEHESLTIGWTGSHSTLKYLDPLVPLLQKLTESFPLRILIICNKPPSFSFKGLEFIQWSEASEIEDLLKIHIGIMPLQEDAWSEGKCGFKIIQYLSLGIPAVASPVGVNKNIIKQGENGFLCKEEKEWEEALRLLLQDPSLRKSMGIKGRQTIIENFSIQAYAGRFLSLFE